MDDRGPSLLDQYPAAIVAWMLFWLPRARLWRGKPRNGREARPWRSWCWTAGRPIPRRRQIGMDSG